MSNVCMRRDTGEITGFLSYVPMRLSVMGSLTRASLGSDLSIHPGYTNKGIARDLKRKLTEESAKSGVSFVYATSNPLSTALLCRETAIPIARLKRYSRKLGIYYHLLENLHLPPLVAKTLNSFYAFLAGIKYKRRASALRKALGTNVRSQTQNMAPELFDELWAYMRRVHILSFWKDVEFLKWRYDKNPHSRPLYFCIFKDEKPIALAVVAERKQTAYIMEFICRDRKLSTARFLLNEIERKFLSSNLRALAFGGTDDDFFSTVFKDYSRQPEFDHQMVGQVASDSLLQRLFSEPSNWTLTFGDSDGLII